MLIKFQTILEEKIINFQKFNVIKRFKIKNSYILKFNKSYLLTIP